MHFFTFSPILYSFKIFQNQKKSSSNQVTSHNHKSKVTVTSQSALLSWDNFDHNRFEMGTKMFLSWIKCRSNMESSEERVIILLTASSLHNVILNDEIWLPLQIDVESISTRIMNFYEAWKSAYVNVDKPQIQSMS